MASRRQDLSSEVSSEENSPDPLPADDEPASGLASKRSYECIFCKRGFTNAQALGGHMNIHRKDRARAKQVVAGPSHSNPSNTPKPPKHYPVWESQMGYYAGTSHISMWDANRQYSSDSAAGNFFDYHSAPRPGYSGTNYEVTCAILSSRMELSHVENYEEQSTKEEEEEDDEIDLELRLGRCGR